MNYKIQALNGFNMYFDQIISVFRAKYESEDAITLDQLSEISCLNRRKARLILNFLADLGLSKKRTLGKTDLGSVIFKNDGYLQNEGTLWLLHYLQSTNDYLIIWNRTMNYLCQNEMVHRDDLVELFVDLKDDLSEYTYKHHIGKEIRIILDAYTNQRFSKLSLIESDRDSYRVHKNADVPSLIILCTIIIYRDANYPGATAVSISELCNRENAPGRILILDEQVLRRKLEVLKNEGIINIESRGDLDQIRIGEDMSLENILTKYYQE